MRFAKYGISPYMLLITVDEMSSRRTREFDNEFISNFWRFSCRALQDAVGRELPATYIGETTLACKD